MLLILCDFDVGFYVRSGLYQFVHVRIDMMDWEGWHQLVLDQSGEKLMAKIFD